MNSPMLASFRWGFHASVADRRCVACNSKTAERSSATRSSSICQAVIDATK